MPASVFRMTSTHLTNWLYVWLFIAAGGALVVLILLFSKLINPSHLTPEKLAPYECGMPPVGDARERQSVKFYLVAMIFLLLDIEVAFLYPWAMALRGLGWTGFVQVVLFFAVLLAGYLYVWKKGALDWSQRA